MLSRLPATPPRNSAKGPHLDLINALAGTYRVYDIYHEMILQSLRIAGGAARTIVMVELWLEQMIDAIGRRKKRKYNRIHVARITRILHSAGETKRVSHADYGRWAGLCWGGA